MYATHIETVACSSYDFIHISIAAMADIGGEAVFFTGRCGYNCLVIVAGRLDGLCLEVITVRAVTLLFTIVLTSCFLGGYPLAHVMTQGRTGIHQGVRLSTVVVTLGSLSAILGAGCIIVGHVLRETVTQLILVICLINVATVAGISGIAILSAGRCGYRSLMIVAGCFDNLGLEEVAARARSPLGAIFGTGCTFNNCPITHVVI